MRVTMHMDRKRLVLLVAILPATSCAQRDLSFAGGWESFTETHRAAFLDLRPDGTAEFQTQTWIAGERDNAQTTRLSGRWATRDDVVIVEYPEGEARYRLSSESTTDQTTEFPCHSLVPIEGFYLAGTDTLWNPPLTPSVAGSCLGEN